MLECDPAGKWLIQQHGDALLRLSGARRVASWKAIQAEPVQPRRLPDGILEVHFRGRPRPVLYVLEISTYPYSRIARQAVDDALLVYLKRGVVPEFISIVLRPRGKKPVPRELVVVSEEGTTRIQVEWKVVELWKIPAADLLATGDIGLIPLVPLSQFDGPVEPILEECRERIERDAPAKEKGDLTVVTHFFAGLKYNDSRLFQKLGGTKAMLKTGSPLLREIYEEATREGERKGRRETAESAIIEVLTARFGPEAEALRTDLKAIGDTRLKGLLGLAVTCPDLASFRAHLRSRKRQRRS
jgi:predicted transposase YdaD